MSKKAGISKWYESVLKLLDGTIAYQEYEVLESKLLDNPSAFDEYLEFIIIYSCMHEPLGLFDNILTFDPSEEPTVDMGVLEKLAEYEKNVKTVEVERVKKPADRVLTEEERQAKIRAFLAEERKIEEQEQLSDELERRKIRRREQRRRQRAQRAQLIAAKVRGYLRSAAIAAILMVIGYLVYAVMHPPEPASVATLTNGADVKWADSRQPAEPDSPLGPGPMKLVEGYARITFNEGAGIVLEAPAEIN
ncbi:MAG TPA: hypothetical protein HPP87_12415, partial [Planctomycetes bacterium]|nr:hypothetical protein [Planctomycetota bacterium]